MKLSASEGVAYAEEARASAPLIISTDVLKHHTMASEYAQVCRTPVDGIFVSPSAENPNVWFGVIFIRKGIFGGGIFRFSVKIPEDFPDTVTLPVITFDICIFHPLIDTKSKQLDLSRSFPDGWKREKHNLLRVLIVIQRIFFSYEFDCNLCVNAEAAILYKEDKEKFKELAKQAVETSRTQVYDDPADLEDSNSIRLTPWESSVHELTRQQMMLIANGQRHVGSPKKAKISNATAAEFRRENEVRNTGVSTAEVVGKHFPKSYSWFDPDGMTVLTREVDEKDKIASLETMSSARVDREKHGIEPLDLSTISGDNSQKNSPCVKASEEIEGDRKLEGNGKIDQNDAESVI